LDRIKTKRKGKFGGVNKKEGINFGGLEGVKLRGEA